MKFLDAYSFSSHFDEMVDERGNVREHWEKIVRHLERVSIDEIACKQTEMRWNLEENGVTYNVYNAPDGQTRRPWHLDPIPFVLKEEEWEVISRGIEQRATLLNLIFKDLYGEQRLLKENIIPAEVIFAHKGFLPEVYGMGVREDFQLYLYALDMARGPDGKMWVVNDRAQAPSGLGYAIENRLTMNPVAQALYPQMDVKKVVPFVERYHSLLHTLTNGDISQAALLTPGPYNETYFEQAYLSSFLGIHLVQGDDLLAKDGVLWLKSLSGLKPIKTLIRRLDESYCDPLELRSDSKLGVAGLLNGVRQERVTLINPMGSGVVENIGLNPFMERICQYFLHESLLLPQIATWWCGQASELSYVLEHFESLMIKKIDRTESVETFLVRTLPDEMKERLRERLLQSPHQYVAQEEIAFSTTPVYVQGRIEPRHAVIRAFGLLHDGHYHVMNGGLVRVSASSDALLVSSKSGGGSKDLWILGEERGAMRSLSPLAFVDSSLAQMSTLQAENLFWLGRYLARMIESLRLIRYVVKKMAHSSHFEGTISSEAKEVLQKALTHLTMTYPDFLSEEVMHHPMDEIHRLVFDEQIQGSLSFTLKMLFNAHLNVKNLLTIESWKLFDTMQKTWGASLLKTPHDTRVMLNECDALLIHLMAYKALIEENMSHEQGVLLYDIGFKLEAGLLGLSKARSMLCFVHDKQTNYDLLEALLSSCEGFNAYRTHYKRSLQRDNVVDFLILTPRFPKSIASLVQELREKLALLPKSLEGLSSYEEPIQRAFEMLEAHHVADVMAKEEEGGVNLLLDALLSQVSEALFECAMALSKTYFSHDDE